MGLALVLDEAGRELNQKDGWIENSGLEPVKNFGIILPNGLEKVIKEGWKAKDSLIVDLFGYGAWMITNKCPACCNGLCAADSVPLTKMEKGVAESAPLLFAGELAKIVSRAKYRGNFSYYSDDYGNFEKTHISSPSTHATFCFTGGEPTAHRQWKDILNEFMHTISDSQKRIVFATNGVGLNNETFGFFEKLKDKGFELQLSYNRPLEEDYIKRRLSPLKEKLKSRENALLETIAYAARESCARGISLMVRITGSLGCELDGLSKQFEGYMEKEGLAPQMEYLHRKGDYFKKVRIKGPIKDREAYVPYVPYYSAETAPIGRAKKRGALNDENDEIQKPFPNEIFIRCPVTDSSGSIPPHVNSHMAQHPKKCYGYIGLPK